MELFNDYNAPKIARSCRRPARTEKVVHTRPRHTRTADVLRRLANRLDSGLD